ncbi:TPA: hypothetical protein ACH9V1_005400, partial [Escherichia coli]
PCVNALRRVESLTRFHIYLSRIRDAPIIFLRPAKVRGKFMGVSPLWSSETFFQPSGPGKLPSFLPYILNALWRILPFSGFPDREDPKSH